MYQPVEFWMSSKSVFGAVAKSAQGQELWWEREEAGLPERVAGIRPELMAGGKVTHLPAVPLRCRTESACPTVPCLPMLHPFVRWRRACRTQSPKTPIRINRPLCWPCTKPHRAWLRSSSACTEGIPCGKISARSRVAVGVRGGSRQGCLRVLPGSGQN